MLPVQAIQHEPLPPLKPGELIAVSGEATKGWRVHWLRSPSRISFV
jgi:hypothetical protein